MKTTKHHITNNLDSAKKSRSQKDRIAELDTLLPVNANKNRTSESQLLLRLSKMKEINIQLERLFEDEKKLLQTMQNFFLL